jgi:hypothetical protein
MMSRLFLAVAAFAVLGLGAATKPDVRAVVERASRWVQQFERDFTTVIADEQYDQLASGPSEADLQRRIRSEIVFLRPESGKSWVAVRNVLAYADAGEPPVEVSDSADRLRAALAGGRPEATTLRRLADESARFNIGGLARNFNTPTFALQFLDDEHRSRFKFRVEGREAIAGDEVWRLAYHERSHPTIVQANYRDTELEGTLWTRATDGAVLRTRMQLKASARGEYSSLDTIVTVEYERDAKLNAFVPSTMQEEYREPHGHVVTARAVYSNYRIFETSARVISTQ